MKIRVLAITIILFFGFQNINFAQGLLNADIVSLKIEPAKKNITPGEKFNVLAKVTIQEQWHINANKPLEEFLIPTELNFTDNSDFTIEKVTYPEPEKITFAFSENPVLVYEHEITIIAEVKVNSTSSSGDKELKGTLNFQGCNDATCLPPDNKEFTLKLTVSGEAVPETGQSGGAVPTAGQFTADEQKAKDIIEKGLPYALLFFFISGLALNLTPCVYPVIPITVSFFGSQNRESKGSTLIIALFYVLGIALIFALLGLISALAGQQWGFLFQNTWFVVIVGLIIFAMAASMFGAFEIQVPSKLMTSVVKSRQGVLGSLIMGLTVGFVIAPCAAGIIIGLVGLVAKLGIVAKGTLLFFVMGLGLGLPYLFLATFSGLLAKRPKPGAWMSWVRQLFGILLIGVGFYFIIPQAVRIPDQQSFYFGLIAIFGGLLLGFLDQTHGYSKSFKIFRIVVGIILIFLGINWMNNAIASMGDSSQQVQKNEPIEWIHYSSQDFEAIIDTDKPVALDFYADWCAPCKKMNRTTFVDSAVVRKSREFTMIKIDCTNSTPEVEALMKKFSVSGMPTLVFMTPDDKEKMNLRAVEYLGPEDYLDRLNKVTD